ncbi:hypothetical protein SY88_10945 [Clostridiales bacterium PH28_bin88]|nr:hypothetical protein SY88_10945 [Clostridiales bacterium PH28_bin88]
MRETFVVVIGGGVTGTGVLRDLALRGIPAVLLEAGDLATGSSCRFHGLLHSGARYAVSDPDAARECAEENAILRKIAPFCIEETGGYFVLLPQDDPGYCADWVRACHQAGIFPQEVDRQSALTDEPLLNPEARRVFRVPDASVDGFLLAQSNATDAVIHGAQVRTYTKVTGILREGNRVTGVAARSLLTGDEEYWASEWVINAAGAWSAEVARMAGLSLELTPDKGSLLVFNHRLTSKVVNRCRYPADGDILVPHGPVSIFGTTSMAAGSPEDLEPDYWEVVQLMAKAREIIPSLDGARVLRAFAGVRPLLGGEGGEAAGPGRGLSRNFSVINHRQEDNVEGFISVFGGKLTTYRLMAQQAVDLLCSITGNKETCRTALLPLPRGESRAGDGCADPCAAMAVCECERASRGALEALDGAKIHTLDDLRRRLRLGMGPCQGMTCGFRAAGLLEATGTWTAERASRELAAFIQNRWKGSRHTLWGHQVRQFELTRGIYGGTFQLTGEEYHEV